MTVHDFLDERDPLGEQASKRYSHALVKDHYSRGEAGPGGAQGAGPPGRMRGAGVQSLGMAGPRQSQNADAHHVVHPVLIPRLLRDT
jgi:hypothetical protein